MRGLKIGDWRAKIDAIDATLLHLLNVRAAFALEVGKLKGDAGMLLRVPKREREILSRMKAVNPGPLDSEAVEKIYQSIMHESIRIQESHGYGAAGAKSISVKARKKSRSSDKVERGRGNSVRSPERRKPGRA